MSRCYHLGYKSNGLFGSSNDYYFCELCPIKQMKVNDPQVKHVCNADYGDKYKDCPIYKERR